MSKLRQRLEDPARSGVYRIGDATAVRETATGELRLAEVVLGPGEGRAQILARLAAALAFPKWFGGNWDALEDCLTDLSWSKARGHVVLVQAAAGANADDVGVLEDILASAAAHWAERKRPFFAVFVGGRAALPVLHRD